MRALLCCLALTLVPPCDISMEHAGGSKAGQSYSFAVTSSAVPITITATIGGDALSTITVNDKQQTVKLDIPNDARGKTLEIVAENNDGCLITWSETVQ